MFNWVDMVNMEYNLWWFFIQPHELEKSDKKGTLIASLDVLQKKFLTFDKLINK